MEGSRKEREKVGEGSLKGCESSEGGAGEEGNGKGERAGMEEGG